MAKVNWEFDYEYYGKDPIKDWLPVIRKYELQGFEYIPYDAVLYASARVKTPSGRILTPERIEMSLENLEFGNKEQIESLKAAEYFKLVTAYNSSSKRI